MAEDNPSASDHPPTWKFDLPIFHAEHRAQWRAWLATNHDDGAGRLAVLVAVGVRGRPVCPYPEAVEEAICFGWIDSTVNTLDDDRALQLMTPRKPKSTWTRLNRQRAESLEEAGLMTDAGRRSIVIARQNGWWTIYDPVEDLLEPADLAAALDADADARARWDGFPPSARKMMLWWVISAARATTPAAAHLVRGRESRGRRTGLRMTNEDYSVASASASLSAGWTSRLSTMSLTRRLAVTARAMTEISSAAWRPTIEPPSTTPVAGSEMIFTKPRGSSLISALALAENGTLVTRILRPDANASASAKPTSAISGSVKIAEAALS